MSAWTPPPPPPPRSGLPKSPPRKWPPPAPPPSAKPGDFPVTSGAEDVETVSQREQPVTTSTRSFKSSNASQVFTLRRARIAGFVALVILAGYGCVVGVSALNRHSLVHFDLTVDGKPPAPGQSPAVTLDGKIVYSGGHLGLAGMRYVLNHKTPNLFPVASGVSSGANNSARFRWNRVRARSR